MGFLVTFTPLNKSSFRMKRGYNSRSGGYFVILFCAIFCPEITFCVLSIRGVVMCRCLHVTRPRAASIPVYDKVENFDVNVDKGSTFLDWPFTYFL